MSLTSLLLQADAPVSTTPNSVNVFSSWNFSMFFLSAFMECFCGEMHIIFLFHKFSLYNPTPLRWLYGLSLLCLVSAAHTIFPLWIISYRAGVFLSSSIYWPEAVILLGKMMASKNICIWAKNELLCLKLGFDMLLRWY